MPSYTYEARDPQGNNRTGVLEAESEQEAVRSLRAEGLTITNIHVGKGTVDPNRVLTDQAAKRVKREEVIAFSSQLAVMLETGVPLSEALGAYLAQSRSTGLRRIVEIVTERVHSGMSFSAAISQFPRVFPTLMVSLMRASEATGAMGPMLSRVADYLGRERRTVKQIRGALTYPMAMVTLAIGVTVFLVAWVLPKFAKIYESRSAALPTPTRILLNVSDFLTNNWLSLALGVAGVVVMLSIIRGASQGRRAIDWLKINSPVIGPIFTNFYLSRAARTLGTLLAAGVTLPEAVRITRGVTGNTLWDDLWDEMEQAMTSGKPIGEVALSSPMLPASAAQMIASAEKSGRLGEVLERIGAVAEEDLDEAVKTGTQMIEPLMITFMGALIGGIAIALLLPIFTMGSAMGG